MPKVYIAGPMRNIPDDNFPAFFAAEVMFRQLGWEVINPARLNLDVQANTEMTEREKQREYARRDLSAITDLKGEEGDAIAMLPGWLLSVGANAEYRAALWVGLVLLDARTGASLHTACGTGTCHTFKK
jgi:hypothetical protein